MTVSKRELEVEQAYFDEAAKHRERRRERAVDPDGGLSGIHPAAAAAIRESNLVRANSMGSPDSPVAFWRITEESGDQFYIGRFPILDEQYEPLVISWKSDKAALFAQATRQQRLGLTSKRIYETDGNTILDIVDDHLTEEGPEESVVVARDAILRSLAKRRDGRLSDIVTTIEKAQDEIMRAPSPGVLVVQGGPGTGKTVIGLQRLSVIAYRDRLEKDELLFVGPTGGFLQYIGNVLPTLGDEGVHQLAISSLAPLRPRRLHKEATEAARVKGDPRMVELLKRALSDRHTKADDDAKIEVDGQVITLDQSDVSEAVDAAEALDRPHNIARESLRESLIRRVVDKTSITLTRTEITDASVRSSIDFNNLLDRTWQTYSPQEFLRDLLGSERRLKLHSDGLFTEEEILTIARPPQARIADEPWTQADMALLDEIEVLLNGRNRIPSYDHVVVDEAQDLSPMQLRAIARRRGGGMTVLGDLAQATGPWAHRSWNEVTSTLSEKSDDRLVELEIGYRVPQEVMQVASHIAGSLDIPVKLPRPIRSSGVEPRFVSGSSAPPIRAAINEVRFHLKGGRSVGLVSAETSLREVAAALRYEGLEFGDGEETTLRPITLVSAAGSKGLEFDAVVIVEPSDIAEAPSGLSELFVATTRTTSGLSIVFGKPLPKELQEFVPNVDEQHPTDEEETAKPNETPVATSQVGEPSAREGSKVMSDSSIGTASLSEAAIDALVEQVANAVFSTLKPSAVDEFIKRLSEKLRDDD